MLSSDTIVAISTPQGVGGIAVVRLSGPDALTIAEKHLSPLTSHLSPRHATYCHFDDIDDIVAVFYPKGYTGEPTVELSCHGSLYVQQAMLQALVDDGARLAEPGEFTRRAFLNGRLNLSQAEAVADLIDSVTPAQHRLAVSQLRGGYAQILKDLRQQLLDLTSLLELELDFSQEDVEFADRAQLREILSSLHLQLSTLLSSFRMGNALKRGIPVAIVGQPNAGKSSLLNALLGDDRAIVSDIPGTTRDTIEETLTLDGITFRFIDTAGLRHSDDTVETLGIERTRKAVADAYLVLFVHDATTPWQEPDIDFTDKHVVVVLNKSDLPQHALATPQFSILNSQFSISTKNGTGLPELRAAMLDVVRGEIPDESNVLLSNVRHYEAMQRVQQALDNVRRGLEDGTPADLVAVDLRDALYHLGAITGEVTSDEVLGNIFGRFCVGK
jgi:tRNA modification GTPase